ncbi:MAG: HD domain-containing protein [Pseudomonadota bacterium]
MGNDIVRIAEALDYAAVKHVHQRRKGELAEPYLNHVTEVARLIATATEGKDPNLVIAALLHDTMEDQGVGYDELCLRFGEDVANLVQEVTDDMSIPKPERKLLQQFNASLKSPRAKMLRIADKTSNLHSLLNSPPKHWDMERKREYFEWSRRVVEGCRGVNAALETVFDAAYQRRGELESFSLQRAA